MTSYMEEMEELRKDYDSNPEKWRGIPWYAAMMYVSALVKNPDDIREYMRRKIPPDEAGNDLLGLPNTLEEKFQMLGI